MAEATLKQITEFFGIPLNQFAKEWKQLTESDREQLKKGIGDGSLTY